MTPDREHIPTVMPTGNRPQNLGKTINDDTSRLDAVAKVTGRARYARDRYLPDSLFAGFIRCPYGAGELEGADTDAARAVPGVVDVQITGKQGQYHGHPVGHLVAESPLALRRGLRALSPRWKRSPAKTRITDGIGEAPAPSPETQALLDRADHVLEAEYSTPVQTHACLETHGSVIDHRGDHAVAYVTTQGVIGARDGLSDPLGLPQARYEVVCEYMGGGFGSKLNGAGKEGATAARVAAKYQRPVYFFVDRAEDQLDTGNRPSSRTRVKIGFMADGTVLGGQILTYGGVGVGRRGGGVGIPSRQYDLGEIDKQHTDVRFSAGAPRPFRAPGRPQGAFTEELMLDMIAATIGMDPLDLRLKLAVEAYQRRMLTQAAELIGWDRRAATGAQNGVLRHGFGLGMGNWPRYPAEAEAEVVINRDGSVEVRTGTQDIGTGQRTVAGVLVAEHLGVPLREVTVRIGHSDDPIGPTSGGSMTTPNTAPAFIEAALRAKEQLLSMLADRAGADAGEFEVADGEVLRDGRRFAGWREACSRMPQEAITARGRFDGRNSRHLGEGHSQAAQGVDLVVDAETGAIRINRIVAVQACGRVVCRKTAENQIIGAVTQGVSYALFEDRLLDPNVGAMVNPNLEMYKIAGIADAPHIEPVLWIDESQTGARSLGEPPTIPTAGAIACAVYNALGVPVSHLPLTPDKVLAALRGGAA
jgi:xanthine dehydrogenase YagR molybdenum-binding subunit